MRKALWVAGGSVVFVLACASTQASKKVEAEPALPQESPTPPAAKVEPAAQVADLKYVDDENGFEIERPNPEWSFRSGEELSTESIAVPLVVANGEKGAQVVVQVAPAVATPAQFAERLTEGLTSRAGFETSEIKPIPLAEGAVGFDFDVGEQVHGRVAILEGAEGRVYVLLATWPQSAPGEVEREVDQILGSMKAHK